MPKKRGATTSGCDCEYVQLEASGAQLEGLKSVYRTSTKLLYG